MNTHHPVDPQARALAGTFEAKVEKLLPCPFCGAAAEIEETELLGAIRKTAGCSTESCQGYQSTMTFATRREAAKAWNKRSVSAADQAWINHMWNLYKCVPAKEDR